MTDATMSSWIEVPEGHDFPLANLPFGIFSTADRDARPGIRLGDHVIDLSALHAAGLLDGLGLSNDVLSAPVLNPLMRLGKPVTVALRERVQTLFAAQAELRDHQDVHSACLVPFEEVTMHMPVEVATTRTSTPARTTPETWVRCFATLKTHCCPIGNTCR